MANTENSFENIALLGIAGAVVLSLLDGNGKSSSCGCKTKQARQPDETLGFLDSPCGTNRCWRCHETWPPGSGCGCNRTGARGCENELPPIPDTPVFPDKW